MSDQLNTEEREILEKFERGELKSAPGADREMEMAPLLRRSNGQGAVHLRGAPECRR